MRRDPIRERLAALSTTNGDFLNRSAQAHTWSEAFVEQLPQTRQDNGILDRELRRAGYYKRSARNEYLGLRNASVILVVLVAGILAVSIGPENDVLAIRVVLGGLALAAVAYAVPRLILRYQGNRRVERIRRALPDALDMMTMCLTGGLPMQDSLVHVSREIYLAHSDLAVELVIAKQHAEMNSMDDAFQMFAKRIDAPEIVNLSALISQAQRLGTNVSEAVKVYADEIRGKRRHLADERANKASVKMLFPVIFCLVPAVMIVLWGPAALELLTFFQGFEGASSFAPPQ